MDAIDLYELMDYSPPRVGLTIKEVAYLLGIDEGTLRWMRNHPKPHHPPYVKVKGRYAYPTQPLVPWLINYAKTHPKSLRHLSTIISRRGTT